MSENNFFIEKSEGGKSVISKSKYSVGSKLGNGSTVKEVKDEDWLF
jgi:hypothetical protein